MKKLTKIWLLLAAMTTWGSNPQVMAQGTFQKTFGNGYANSVKKTSDGNLIIAGGPLFLLKMDPNGNVIWRVNYFSTGSAEATSVEQTADGGYIIGGTMNAGGPVSKVLLLKTDSNGNVQWAKSYGGANYEFGNQVKETLDGGFVIVGNTTSFGIQFDDIYVIKTGSNGNLQWSKTIADSPTDYVDVGNSIKQISDSSYIVCARVGNSVSNSNDAGLIKINKNGNLLWAKYYGGTGDDGGYSVISTSDGGYAFAGYTKSFGAGNKDAYLVKVDINGNHQWSKTFGNTSSDAFRHIDQLIDGSYILSGYAYLSGNSIIGLKLDINGDTLWTKKYDGGQYALGYAATNIGSNYYYTGNYGANSDVYFIKADSVGVSGCFEGHPNLTITTPSTTVTTPSVTVSNSATAVNTISFTTSSASTVNTLCSLVSVPEVHDDQFVMSEPQLIRVYDVLGQEVRQVYPDNIYIYQYVDKKGNSFFRKQMIVR
jgi:hypothetical protein